MLSQKRYQYGLASYLAEVNQRRSEFEFDELTRDEIGIKLAYAFKTDQSELRQSALDYLHVRGNLLDQGMDSEELLLDLATCDLSGANLKWANLRQADLRAANLRGANLSEADLWAANLSEANLLSTNLSGANLSEADLRGVYLFETNLKWAYLWGADLRGARYLEYITALGANFTGAKLGQAELQALNELDQKQGDLLVGTSGLVRNKSGEIIGVESLPDPEPEIENAQVFWNSLAKFLSDFSALPVEEQEAFLDKLRK